MNSHIDEVLLEEAIWSLLVVGDEVLVSLALEPLTDAQLQTISKALRCLCEEKLPGSQSFQAIWIPPWRHHLHCRE